jgi:AcrR family transcriptional regulator
MRSSSHEELVVTIRTAQKEVTRQRILGAVLDLVAEGGLAEVTVPDVARASGASVATIYRYYPTKDALFEAAAGEPARRAAGELPDGELAGGSEYLRVLWRAFAENMALLRHQLASDAGRDMRATRYETSRRWFVDACSARGIDPDSRAGERVVRIALLLTSSLAFVDLHDRQGVDADTAVADVSWAIETLVAATLEDSR